MADQHHTKTPATAQTAAPVAPPHHEVARPDGTNETCEARDGTELDTVDSAHDVGKEEPTKAEEVVATPPLDGPIPGQSYVTGFKLAIVVACMALACFLMLVDTMVISTAIPRITDEFHSLVDVGWYASAYQFGMSAPQPLIGKIYTHFRTRFVFLACFAIFEVGSVLCGAASSSAMLIVGRTIAGLGAAGIVNGAITIVSSCAPLEKRPSLFGLTMAVQQLGLVVGPILGGAFTSYSTWRWSFYINLPIGVPVVAGILFLPIPEQTPKKPALSVFPKIHQHLDLIGFCLFAPAVIQLLLALQYGGNQYPWDSSVIIGLFCGAAATGAVWLFWNYRQREAALLPPEMVQRRAVWTGAMFNGFLMVAIYGTLYYLPIYFQSVNDATPMMSGVYIMPMFLPQLVMAALAGGILQAMGYVIPLAVVSSILFSIGSGLLSTLRPDTGVGKWVGYQILSGVGSGAGMPMAIIAIQGVTTGEELSSAMAFLVFTQSLFPAIILPVCNLILLESLKVQLPRHAASVDPEVIVQAGATGFRSSLGEDDISGVLIAYTNSLSNVFYVVTAFAALSFVFLWGMGWQDLRKKVDNEGAKPEDNSSSPTPQNEEKSEV